MGIKEGCRWGSDQGKHQERMNRHGNYYRRGEEIGFKWRMVPFYSSRIALSF